jgi:hypothetical protein
MRPLYSKSSHSELANLLASSEALKTSMHWKFWIALCGILISIGVVIGLNIALYMQGAAITISGAIVSIASMVPAEISSLGLFQTWNKNRKEEERIPVLEFDGFLVTKEMVIRIPPRAGWLATTYSVRVKKKTKGLGKAEQSEGFVSLTGTLLSGMCSRWLPDDVALYDIANYMYLILFQIIPLRKELSFHL